MSFQFILGHAARAPVAARAGAIRCTHSARAAGPPSRPGGRKSSGAILSVLSRRGRSSCSGWPARRRGLSRDAMAALSRAAGRDDPRWCPGPVGCAVGPSGLGLSCFRVRRARLVSLVAHCDSTPSIGRYTAPRPLRKRRRPNTSALAKSGSATIAPDQSPPRSRSSLPTDRPDATRLTRTSFRPCAADGPERRSKPRKCGACCYGSSPRTANARAAIDVHLVASPMVTTLTAALASRRSGP